jgi:hypothetical protein
VRVRICLFDEVDHKSIMAHSSLLVAVRQLNKKFCFKPKAVEEALAIVFKRQAKTWKLKDTEEKDWITTVSIRLRNLFRVVRHIRQKFMN